MHKPIITAMVIVIYVSYKDLSFAKIKDSNAQYEKEQDVNASEKQKRSIWSAVKTILAGTDQVLVTPELRLYYKHGGLKQAIEDFDSLQPKDVKIHEFQDRSGVVDGVRIYMKNSGKGPPVLVIPGQPLFNQRFRLTREIIYFEKYEDMFRR